MLKRLAAFQRILAVHDRIKVTIPASRISAFLEKF
jgi:hypothetical protein